MSKFEEAIRNDIKKEIKKFQDEGHTYDCAWNMVWRLTNECICFEELRQKRMKRGRRGEA